MVSHEFWFTETKKGKIKINRITIYQDLSSEIVNKLEQNLSVSEIIVWLRSIPRENFSNATLTNSF